jgi:threonine/homoserine/homoserine lactone efflux protein
MNTDMILAFSAGMLILAATPGPGVIGAVSKAMAEGFRASLYFIGGLALGDTIFFLLALGGLSAISRLMGDLFVIIRLFGGLYLIYLGIRLFRTRTVTLKTSNTQENNRIKTFAGGLLLTLGNPKPILFYASVLPVIINMNDINPLDAAAMLFTIVAVSFIVLGFYCYMVSLSGKFLKKASAQSRVNKVGGSIMCITGTYVMFKQ